MNLNDLQTLQKQQIRLDEIDEYLKNINNNQYLIRLKEEYHSLKSNFEVCNSNLKSNSARQDIKRNEISNLEQNKASLDDIKYSKDINTVKKLESIDKQIIDVKSKINEIEEGLINCIEEGENIQKQINEIKKKIHFIKKKYLTLKEEKEKDKVTYIEERNSIENEINALRSGIDDDYLEIYDKVRKRHKNPVVFVYHRVCDGCKMEIGGVDYEKVKEGIEIIRCESCGRILIYVNGTNS